VDSRPRSSGFLRHDDDTPERSEATARLSAAISLTSTRRTIVYLHEVAGDNFVLLQAGWPVERARRLIERLAPTHVIVHRTEPEDYYYLYTASEALDRLASAYDDASIFDAFNLHEHDATPTYDAYANADLSPDRSVVIEEGLVVGFFDVTVPPEGTCQKPAISPSGAWASPGGRYTGLW